MDQVSGALLVDTSPMHPPTSNQMSFEALSKSHATNDSNSEILQDLNVLNNLPCTGLAWRDDSRKSLDNPNMSPALSSGSPYNMGIPNVDFESEVYVDEIPEYQKKDIQKVIESVVKTERVVKTPSRTLQYPPCCVCGGKASGDHYGVNSCEACKGFFRRYLLRKKGAYHCKNVGQCEISHTKRGMCAGCRLKKCLELGMSKEKCKLGRYSAEKRTEKIRTVKAMNDGMKILETDLDALEAPTQADTVVDSDIISQTFAKLTITDKMEESFSDDIIQSLIKAKRVMRPFGKHIDANNHEEVKQHIRAYHEEFQARVLLYGELKPVSKEEFLQLYKTYGIDVDNRMNDLKLVTTEIDEEIYDICNFMRCIPYFSKLTIRDQAKLLKVGITDFYTTLCAHAYDPELEIGLDKYKAFHVSEMYKVCSKELVTENLRCVVKCQSLNLDESEEVLVMALGLVFTDRCSLDNPGLVEKIQLSLTQLLKQYLDKSHPKTARTRLTSIIEYLTELRKGSEMFGKAMQEFCNEEVYSTEFPIFRDFLVNE